MTHLEEIAEKAYLEAEIACAKANRKGASKKIRDEAELKLQNWYTARSQAENATR